LSYLTVELSIALNTYLDTMHTRGQQPPDFSKQPKARRLEEHWEWVKDGDGNEKKPDKWP
jgi:hypothetical protein